MDTGIQYTHQDFGGRMGDGVDLFNTPAQHDTVRYRCLASGDD